MKIEQLKEIVANYNPIDEIHQENDKSYASLLAIEQILKNKQNELYQKINEYEKHLSKLLKRKCKIGLENLSPTPLRSHQIGSAEVFAYFHDTILPGKKSEIQLTYFLKPCFDYSKKGRYTEGNPYKEILENDEKTKEFIKYYRNWCEEFYDRNSVKNNAGLSLDIFHNELDEINIVLSDRDKIKLYNDKKTFNIDYFLGNVEKIYGRIRANFYFHKNVLNNQRQLKYLNDECKDVLNESQIANIYSTLQVDISSYSKETQEEIKKYEGYYKLKLHENADKDKNELKRLQTQRLLEAYNKLKEAVELLNNLKMEIDLEKIKLEDLELMFFKNQGKPNKQGFIEIDDMFRNNMLLRLLDLSEIDLTKVDIRNIDFSGCNIHIDPQKIHNKDMTNVNATGVKFSPFNDSFDGVILDGTIIDDWEAAINIEKIKSYNNQTQIPQLKEKSTLKM